MKVIHAFAGGAALVASLMLGNLLHAQTLDTPSGGVRDGSDTAGSGNVGPIGVRQTPGAGTELTVPATPPTSPRTGANLRDRTVQKDNAIDATDHTIEEPSDIRYSEKPPGTTGVNPSNQWRFRFTNNHWWYWQPNNTWVFWYQGRWVPFNPDTYGQYYPMASANANLGPRARFYSNREQSEMTSGAAPSRTYSGYRGPWVRPSNPGTSQNTPYTPPYTPGAGVGAAVPRLGAPGTGTGNAGPGTGAGK